MKRPIYERLLKFQGEDRYPFHMPGHKRRIFNEMSSGFFQWDITEIDGFDEFHDPHGIIQESMEETRKFYRTKKTWYLVNGSTCGNLAAIGAVFGRGDSILIARNCHRSVYYGVELFGLRPYYVYPEWIDEAGIYGGISPGQVEEMLKKHRKIKGVFLTSPTYEGVVSDIRAISFVCQKYGAALLVDEAHGAHFAYSEYFPESSVKEGADVVVQSLHKTLAVPNQGALLHLCSDKVSEGQLNRYQSIFQTTSPSYVLLAAIEYGIAHARQEKEKWGQYTSLLCRYRERWKGLKRLRLLAEDDFADRESLACYGEEKQIFSCRKNGISSPCRCKDRVFYDYDKGKIVMVIKGGGMTGKQLSSILLKKYCLQMEMAEKNYFIAMTSYMDCEEAFIRLDKAFFDIDNILLEKGEIAGEKRRKDFGMLKAENQAMIPSEALEKKKEWLDLKEAVGRTAGDYVYIYPPGSPFLVPGEKISVKTLEKIQEYLYNEIEVKGLHKNCLCTIEE